MVARDRNRRSSLGAGVSRIYRQASEQNFRPIATCPG
jgi:hypothetical protein